MGKKTDGPSTGTCCNCASTVGAPVKVHPVQVTSYDGVGRLECWCPRCFVWKRMLLEPERWNASFTAAVSCQFCGAVSVCFTVQRGRAQCGACGAAGALMLAPSDADMATLSRIALETAEDVRG